MDSLLSVVYSLASAISSLLFAGVVAAVFFVVVNGKRQPSSVAGQSTQTRARLSSLLILGLSLVGTLFAVMTLVRRPDFLSLTDIAAVSLVMTALCTGLEYHVGKRLGVPRSQSQLRLFAFTLLAVNAYAAFAAAWLLYAEG